MKIDNGNGNTYNLDIDIKNKVMIKTENGVVTKLVGKDYDKEWNNMSLIEQLCAEEL